MGWAALPLVAKVALGASAAGALTSTYAAYQSSRAQKAGLNYQSQVAANNAQLAEYEAQDAENRGVRDAAEHLRKTGALRDRQMNALAANNVDLSEGSALALLTDTQYLGERDAATIRTRGSRDAWARREQAKGYSADSVALRSQSDQISPMFNGMSSLLSGAGQVASNWYLFSKA